MFRMIAICIFLSGVLFPGINLASSHSNDAGYPMLDARHWGLFGGDVAQMDLDVSVTDIPIHPGGWAHSIFADSKSKQSFWNAIHKYRQDGKYQLYILGTSGTYEKRIAQLERIFNNEEGTILYYKDLIGVALGHETTTAQDKMENLLYDYIKSRWPDLQVYKFYSVPIKPYSAMKGGNPERCDGYLYDIYGGNSN